MTLGLDDAGRYTHFLPVIPKNILVPYIIMKSMGDEIEDLKEKRKELESELENREEKIREINRKFLNNSIEKDGLNVLERIKSLLHGVESHNMDSVHKEWIYIICEAKGHESTAVRDAIKEMKREGSVYEPKEHHLSII